MSVKSPRKLERLAAVLPGPLRSALIDLINPWRVRATRGCGCTHPCHLSDSLAYDAGFLKQFLT
jgi:hypothetical protein